MSSVLERAAVVMRDFHAPWGIAGGWALDLFAGSESRMHSDVDIAILRADQRQLRSRLSGRVEKVVDHRLAEWSAEVLDLPVHEVHVTWPDGFQLEFLLNERHDQRAWLRDALHVTARGHRWGGVLAGDA